MLIQWRSQDTEVAWARGLLAAEQNFRLHFSATRMGSRGTFVLCTVSNPCLVRLGGEPSTVIRLKLQGLSSIDQLYRTSWNGIT